MRISLLATHWTLQGAPLRAARLAPRMFVEALRSGACAADSSNVNLKSLSYTLDASSLIVGVSQNFEDFALANGSQTGLHSLLGKSIWSFVQGPVLQACLKSFFERCRQEPGQLPYRCDSPAELREWIVQAVADAEYLQVCFREICRLERPLSKGGAPRLEQPIKFCSWCNALVEKGLCRWPNREEAELIAGRLLFCPRSVSHTLCDRCVCGFQSMDPDCGFSHLRLHRLPVSGDPSPVAN